MRLLLDTHAHERIVLKADKLNVDVPILREAVEPAGFRRLDLSVGHLARQHEIAARFDDPFDLLLLAQADVERLVFVTADSRILGDPPVDLIECHGARRHRRPD